MYTDRYYEIIFNVDIVSELKYIRHLDVGFSFLNVDDIYFKIMFTITFSYLLGFYLLG